MDGSSKHRRFQSDDDTDSGSNGLPQRHRSAHASAPRRPAQGGSGGWFTAPVVLSILTFFGFLVCFQVYQFTSFGGFPPLTEPFYNKTMVQITTKLGTFTIDLYPDHAPKTVANFMNLIDRGFYSTQTGFYRNEPRFMLQGGGFLFDKESPFPNLPVEYSLPSEERMVVIARSQKADSGNAEFAIMLHDNTYSNQPSDDSPGYTAFGRIVEGWHTIELISKKMPVGFVSKENRDRQMNFDKVEYVKRLTNDNPLARRRVEELTHALETAYTVVVFSELDCPETKKLQKIFGKFKAVVRVEEVGYSPHHPYEREAAQAIAGGRDTLPLVFVDKKIVGGLAEIQAMEKDDRLGKLLAASGALAENIAWSAISKHPVVVFSKSYCPYCKRVKETLASLDVKPVVLELDLREDGPAIQHFLFRFTQRSTVPNVFVGGQSIGGSDDTLALSQSGQLQEKLKAVGAMK